jgi:hypothetical protein
MTLEINRGQRRISEIPVEGMRFLDEAGQDLISAQARAILAQAFREFPGLLGLKANRLNLVPTLNALVPAVQIEGLDPGPIERAYMVELEVVPTPELTHYAGYRLIIGAIDIDSEFEEVHGAHTSWKTRTPVETLS